MAADTTHSLELLVDETRQEMESAEGELAAALERAAVLEKKVAVLREEHASFLAALNRRVPAAQTESVREEPEVAETTEWLTMNRTDAVAKALAVVAAVEPASPAQVHKYMSDMGRDDGRDLVSAALAHLKRSGRAWRVGYSEWLPFPPNPSGPGTLLGPDGDGEYHHGDVGGEVSAS